MFKRKSIMIEWGISYALILLVPIIAIFINFNFNVTALKKETVQAYELMLDNLADNMDNIVEKQEKMYTQIYLDTVFKDFMSFADESPTYGYEIYELQKQLSLYELADDTVSFWVYLKGTEYLISNGEAYKAYYIHAARTIDVPDFPKYEEWTRLLTGEYRNEYFFSDSLERETYLVYANTYDSNSSEVANILAATAGSVFEDMTSALPQGAVLEICVNGSGLAPQNKFLFLSSEGVLKLSKEMNEQEQEKIEEGLGLSEHVKLTAGGYRGKLSYHLFVPKESFWDGARYIRKVHFISLILTCLIGIGLVIFLLKRNSRPIYSLLETIGGGDEEQNEFKRLEAAYGHIKQENASMKKSLQIQKKSLVSSYLLSLLKGRQIKNEELERELGLGISLQSCSFVLVGFYIPAEEGSEYDELPFFIVDNIFSELMEKEEFYHVEDGGFLFYLFRVASARADSWEKENLDKIKYLCDFLEEKLDFSLTAVVSAMEQDFSRVKHMYQSVMSAFEYRRIIGGSGVIRAEEVADTDENKKYRGYNRKLVHALENGGIDEAYRVSEQLFAESRNLPFIVLRLRVLEAYQAISDCYNTYIDDSVKRMQLIARLEYLLNAEGEEELKKQFEALLAFASAKINGQWETEDKGLVQMIREYVEANYADCNLNISAIAEGLNRNPRYISTVFKKESGEGILDYVNTLRIRKAQEILLNERVSLEEVSAMVGYANVRTFRRAFTKVVGMVPSSYLEKK